MALRLISLFSASTWIPWLPVKPIVDPVDVKVIGLTPEISRSLSVASMSSPWTALSCISVIPFEAIIKRSPEKGAEVKAPAPLPINT